MPRFAARTRSKYGAQKTVVDGITFASKREAARYVELKLLERAGEITGLTLQPQYQLCAADWHHWFHGLASAQTGSPSVGKYVADFAYFDTRTQQNVVEDVKGFKTPLYRWKKKHVEAQYGIQIREV